MNSHVLVLLTIHLTRRDVTFFPNISRAQHMQERLKKSKTDPFRQTTLITIAKSNSNVCAVCATRELILHTPESTPRSPPFQFKDGTLLSRRILALNLHTLLQLCGLHAKSYNTHSFRIGAATAAAAAGLPAWLIAGALTPMNGTFTFLRLSSFKFPLLWLLITATTPLPGTPLHLIPGSELDIHILCPGLYWSELTKF